MLYLRISLPALQERLSARRVCPACGAVYNLRYLPPKRDALCDRCGENLVQREDDTPEVIAARFQAYMQATAPLVRYYKSLELLEEIPAEKDPETVYAHAEAILRRRCVLEEEEKTGAV